MFAGGFSACPTSEPVAFDVFDSSHRPLAPATACRHLASGSVPDAPGRFYPRCLLGGSADRRRWLTLVTPERLEAFRVLEAEFAAACASGRQKVFAAKRRMLAVRTPETRRELEIATEHLLAAADAFLSEHAARFQAVGMPAPALREVVREWYTAWTNSREFDPPRISAEALQAFGPAGRALLSSSVPDLPAAAEQDIYSDSLVAIALHAEASTVLLRGEIDASNAGKLEEVLVELGTTGADDLHVDLGGLEFCDLAGLTALVRVSQAMTGARRLIVHSLPAYLVRAMTIVGWTALPRLILVGASADAARAEEGRPDLDLDLDSTG